MILDKVAKAENIELSDEEFEQELLMISLQAREPMEQLYKRLEDEGSLPRIREQLLREKTGAALYEKLAG